jgi:hypothetical protein
VYARCLGHHQFLRNAFDRVQQGQRAHNRKHQTNEDWLRPYGGAPLCTMRPAPGATRTVYYVYGHFQTPVGVLGNTPSATPAHVHGPGCSGSVFAYANVPPSRMAFALLARINRRALQMAPFVNGDQSQRQLTAEEDVADLERAVAQWPQGSIITEPLHGLKLVLLWRGGSEWNSVCTNQVAASGSHGTIFSRCTYCNLVFCRQMRRAPPPSREPGPARASKGAMRPASWPCGTLTRSRAWCTAAEDAGRP